MKIIALLINKLRTHQNKTPTGELKGEIQMLNEKLDSNNEIKDEDNKSKTTIKNIIKEYVPVFAGAIILALIVSFFIRPGQVIGSSMTPNLTNNDLVIINKRAYKSNAPKYKDIVIVKSNIDNGRILVKRVIGVPGDTLEIKDNKTYINDKLIDEKYIREPMVNNHDLKVIIPEGKIFVMGDNRNDSLDSRSLKVGLINYKTNVIGKVEFRFFPLKSISKF